MKSNIDSPKAHRRLAIAYGFKKDYITFKEHIASYLPQIKENNFDLLVILSSDNITYEVFRNNQFIEQFKVNPRFIEFESLNFALHNFYFEYDTFIYLNCSLFSKHILSSVGDALKKYTTVVESVDCPCLCGRMDYFDLKNINKNTYISHEFISTFFIIFNKKGGKVIKDMLNQFTPTLALEFSKEFNLHELEESTKFRLAHKNRNYFHLPKSVIKMKASAVLVEKLISIKIYEYGKLISAESINYFHIRFLETLKNFLYKRIPSLRRYLSRF